MEYKNMKTGVMFSSPCVISGGDWVLVEKTKQSNVQEEQEADDKENTEEQEVQEADDKAKTGNENFDSITKEQIMQELDAFGVEYDKRAKKQVLYNLMMLQGG